MFNRLLNSWRKENGFDFDGWHMLLTKRWLRRNKMGFLVPFDYAQDDCDDGIQTLYVWRWGVLKVERYRWPHYRDIDILDRLKKIGMVNRYHLYKVIQAEARKLPPLSRKHRVNLT